jgi:hypothetical protein
LLTTIEDLKGDDGLKGRDANELRRIVLDAYQKLEEGDVGAAQERTGKLLEEAAKAGEELDDDAADRLEADAEAFAEAVGRFGS